MWKILSRDSSKISAKLQLKFQGKQIRKLPANEIINEEREKDLVEQRDLFADETNK